MTGSIHLRRRLPVILTLTLFASSTAFTLFHDAPLKIHRPQPPLRASSSGEELRDFRSKSFSPIETLSSRPRDDVKDDRYSNGVASHVSTLYGSGTVVQDFKEGSAARHTADVYSSVGSKSSAASGASPSINLNNRTVYPGGKHYQLEELEDSETCTTDIFLNTDNTVTVGKTNGPLFLSGGGTWTTSPTSADGDGTFEMILKRKYQTGKEGTQYTDIGEFEYEVERTFRGEMTLVGGAVLAMNGDILDIDDTFGDRRVGFFNMIDTTEARKQDFVDP